VLPPYVPGHAKGTIYQGGIQVPLIVRSPWIAPGVAGTVEDALVCSTDLFATVAEIAQSDPTAWPAGAGEDSVSLVPYLTGSAPASIRRYAYAEDFFPSFQPDPATGAPPPSWVGSRHFQAIRDGRFKLIRRTERDRLDPTLVTVEEEFYDLLRGGPPDTSTNPPTATPDWFEQNDLLQVGSLSPAAASALVILRGTLDSDFPSLVL
jgi:arylsulfatase A-like enzyme